MRKITLQALRDIISIIITEDIGIHRTSKMLLKIDDYGLENGADVIDEEIDDFIAGNIYYDLDLKEQLIDPGLLGFDFRKVRISDNWFKKFKDNTKKWSISKDWLNANFPWIDLTESNIPDVSETWKFDNAKSPLWLKNTPSYVTLAMNILKNGKLLCEMNWRDFEKLIGYLLEEDGWKVEVTKPSKDGGIDVIAFKTDKNIGKVKSVWQAKKYKQNNFVRLSHVRELTAIRDYEKASKAMVVTTSRLTKDAIEWVKRDIYRLDFKEHMHLKNWIESIIMKK
ncbi:MAG: restriction endonuclease [Ignavibacteriae bacterium]|nr:MAG: restriction endonuclease [Ignavibacteriota bacterium]